MILIRGPLTAEDILENLETVDYKVFQNALPETIKYLNLVYRGSLTL